MVHVTTAFRQSAIENMIDAIAILRDKDTMFVFDNEKEAFHTFDRAVCDFLNVMLHNQGERG